jgi:hypothetical protein
MRPTQENHGKHSHFCANAEKFFGGAGKFSLSKETRLRISMRLETCPRLIRRKTPSVIVKSLESAIMLFQEFDMVPTPNLPGAEQKRVSFSSPKA